jgi:hypothetical protein
MLWFKVKRRTTTVRIYEVLAESEDDAISIVENDDQDPGSEVDSWEENAMVEIDEED